MSNNERSEGKGRRLKSRSRSRSKESVGDRRGEADIDGNPGFERYAER